MREKVRDRGRLEHILEAIESIEEFHAQYTFEDNKKNKLIRVATSAERYCNEEQNKIILNDYTTTTPLY